MARHHRNDLRADLGRLEGVLEKKIDEYGKIDSEASEEALRAI